MLPEAEVAFLDEVFLGSTAILNTLLGMLNERAFRRGHTRMQVPAARVRGRLQRAARGRVAGRLRRPLPGAHLRGARAGPAAGGAARGRLALAVRRAARRARRRWRRWTCWPRAAREADLGAGAARTWPTRCARCAAAGIALSRSARGEGAAAGGGRGRARRARARRAWRTCGRSSTRCPPRRGRRWRATCCASCWPRSENPALAAAALEASAGPLARAPAHRPGGARRARGAARGRRRRGARRVAAEAGGRGARDGRGLRPRGPARRSCQALREEIRAALAGPAAVAQADGWAALSAKVASLEPLRSSMLPRSCR